MAFDMMARNQGSDVKSDPPGGLVTARYWAANRISLKKKTSDAVRHCHVLNFPFI